MVLPTRISLGICLLWCALCLAAQPKFSIALIVFKGEGIDNSGASVISDRLRSELVKTGLFSVIERSQMQTVLKQQGFAPAGTCEEVSCLAQMGELLDVERVISGTIGKAGAVYTFSLRVINVATGEILNIVNDDCECSFNTVLAGSTRDLAAKLAQIFVKEVPRTAAGGRTGELRITTTVPAASVQLDGKAVPGETPLVLKGVAAGTHRIVARQKSYYGSATVDVMPDTLLKVFVDMAKGAGSLKVFSEPSGARVLTDEVDKGETPARIDSLPVGEHLLRIVKKGYVGVDDTVAVSADQAASLSVKLQQAAYLTVKALPDWAAILVNGKRVGTGSVSSLEVPCGHIDIQVEASGYEVFRQDLSLAPNEAKSIDAILEAKFASLSVVSVPPGAEVVFNGHTVGPTPYANSRLVPGTYALRLYMSDHDTCDTSLTLTKGEIRFFEARLVSHYGELKVSSVPCSASVSVDGRPAGLTPYMNSKLQPRSHSIAVTMPSYEPVLEDVSVARNEAVDRSYTLKHTKAYLDSVAAAKQAAKKRHQIGRRILFGTLAAGYGGIGVYYNWRLEKAAQDYDAYKGTDLAVHNANWDAVERNRNSRNAFYGIAAAMCVGFLISIPF